MRHWRLLALLLAGLAMVTSASAAPTEEKVQFPSNDTELTHGAPTPLNGVVFRPEGAGPFPAVVLLHGCGGMYTARGLLPKRNREWAERLAAAGYVALLPDSFTTRGVKEVCTQKKQEIQATRERNRDAYGALLYLQTRSDVIPDRIGVMGWSHGGSSTLATVNAATHARPKTGLRADFRAAVAFYPGCQVQANDRNWSTEIPTLILIGTGDIWTPAAPCEDVAKREKEAGHPLELTLYPDAVHGFDSPNEPVHRIPGVNFTRGGYALVGTNPAARADAIPRVMNFFAAKLKS